MGKRGLLAAVLAMAVLAVSFASGCGDSEDEASLTKAEFVKQGDKICKDNYAKREKFLLGYVEDIKASGKQPPQAEQEDILVNELMPIFREQSEELSEIGLPETETGQAEKILAAIEGAIEKVEQEPDVAIKQGTGVQFAEAEKMAAEFGFKYCGRS